MVLRACRKVGPALCGPMVEALPEDFIDQAVSAFGMEWPARVAG